VRKLVGRELNVLVLVETLGDQVAERVVFLVEGEELGIGDTCKSQPLSEKQNTKDER